MDGQSIIEWLMAYGWAILIVVIVAAVLAYYGFIWQPTGGNQTQNQTQAEMHGWTKAVYDGLYLQDYYILCNESVMINATPMGNKIYVGKNWTDPRPVELQKKIC